MKPFLVAAALALATTAAPAGPSLVVDGPVGGDVPQTFLIQGVALSSDAVHAWAHPSTGAVFLGAASPTQPDERRQLETGGFRLLVKNAPVGTYPIVVYARDPVAGTWLTQVSGTFTVRPCVWSAVDWPFTSPGGVPVFWLIEHCR
jgi:hypothetical protein